MDTIAEIKISFFQEERDLTVLFILDSVFDVMIKTSLGIRVNYFEYFGDYYSWLHS